MLEAVHLHREGRQQKRRVALKEHLGVVLGGDLLAAARGLGEVVVRGEVLVGQQRRVEVDLRLEARRAGANLQP